MTAYCHQAHVQVRQQERAEQEATVSAFAKLYEAVEMAELYTCEARRQGDEMYCAACHLRWAVNEEKPLCAKAEIEPTSSPSVSSAPRFSHPGNHARRPFRGNRR